MLDATQWKGWGWVSQVEFSPRIIVFFFHSSNGAGPSDQSVLLSSCKNCHVCSRSMGASEGYWRKKQTVQLLTIYVFLRMLAASVDDDDDDDDDDDVDDDDEEEMIRGLDDVLMMARMMMTRWW